MPSTSHDRPLTTALPSLNAAGADFLMDAACACARSEGLAMCIAVVDRAGDLLAFRRMDGTSVASITGALEKARTAAQFRRPTQEFHDLIDAGQPALLGLHWATSLIGGIPIFDSGVVLGAIAASGASGLQDAMIAQAGAEAWDSVRAN